MISGIYSAVFSLNNNAVGSGIVLFQRSMALYQLLRPGKRVDSEGDIAPSTGQIEMRVFKYLNGERKGEFMAQPYLGTTYSAADFIGRGTTEQEALYAMLDNIKGVPHDSMFPDDEDNE